MKTYKFKSLVNMQRPIYFCIVLSQVFPLQHLILRFMVLCNQSRSFLPTFTSQFKFMLYSIRLCQIDQFSQIDCLRPLGNIRRYSGKIELLIVIDGMILRNLTAGTIYLGLEAVCPSLIQFASCCINYLLLIHFIIGIVSGLFYSARNTRRGSRWWAQH